MKEAKKLSLKKLNEERKKRALEKKQKKRLKNQQKSKGQKRLSITTLTEGGAEPETALLKSACKLSLEQELEEKVESIECISHPDVDQRTVLAVNECEDQVNVNELEINEVNCDGDDGKVTRLDENKQNRPSSKKRKHRNSKDEIGKTKRQKKSILEKLEELEVERRENLSQSLKICPKDAKKHNLESNLQHLYSDTIEKRKQNAKNQENKRNNWRKDQQKGRCNIAEMARTKRQKKVDEIDSLEKCCNSDLKNIEMSTSAAEMYGEEDRLMRARFYERMKYLKDLRQKEKFLQDDHWCAGLDDGKDRINGQSNLKRLEEERYFDDLRYQHHRRERIKGEIRRSNWLQRQNRHRYHAGLIRSGCKQLSSQKFSNLKSVTVALLLAGAMKQWENNRKMKGLKVSRKMKRIQSFYFGKEINNSIILMEKAQCVVRTQMGATANKLRDILRAGQSVTNDFQSDTALESFYGGLRYHVHSHEDYGTKHDKTMYVERKKCLQDMEAGQIIEYGLDDQRFSVPVVVHNLLNEIVNSVCLKDRYSSMVSSDSDRYKVLNKKDMLECQAEEKVSDITFIVNDVLNNVIEKVCQVDRFDLARPCSSFCSIPSNWARKLHDSLVHLLDNSAPFYELCHRIDDFNYCKCCLSSHPYCPLGFDCTDKMRLLRFLSPHFVKIRTLIRILYSLLQNNNWLKSVHNAVTSGNYNVIKQLLLDFKNKDDILGAADQHGNDAVIEQRRSDSYVLDKFGDLWFDFDLAIDSFPKSTCSMCTMYCKENETKVFEDAANLPGQDKDGVEEVLQDMDTWTYPITLCKRCFKDLKSGKVPVLSKFNEVAVEEMPDEIACLNMYETILIKKARPFQTVVRLKPLKQFHGSGDFIQALHGLAVHLPLPLEETHLYVQNTLPSCNNLYILVDSVPTKNKIVWRSLVDLQKVERALNYLKCNNHLYYNVKIDRNFMNSTPDANITMLAGTEEGLLKDITAKSMLRVAPECIEYTNVTLQPLYSGVQKSFPDAKIYQTKKISDTPLNVKDPLLDLRCFPNLYPTGQYGLYSKRPIPVKPQLFYKHKLFNAKPAFRHDIQWLFSEMTRYTDRCISQGVYAVMNTGKFPQMTASQVLKMIEEKNKDLEANLSTLFSNHRGSDEYFRHLCSTLRIMDEELGPCTFFLTLSAAEYQWDDIRRRLIFNNKHINDVDKLRTSYLSAMDPVTTASQFKLRFEALLNNVILARNGPLGQVEHYFARIEYQARGAPHVHMKLWVKDAPIVGGSSDEEIIEFINKHITCVVPDAATSPNLHKLVTTLQMHTCTSSCRRKKRYHGKIITYCRYSYPRKECLTTTLNSTSECLHSRKRGSNQKLYNLRRSSNERFVNDYCPVLLSMWCANMDIQFVSENSMILNNYITSYVSKAEKNMTAEFWSNLNENRSIRSRLYSYAYFYMSKRETGAYEACARILGYPCFYSSDATRFVNTNFPDQRRRKLIDFRVLKEMDGDSQELFHKNLVSDYYPNRPDFLQDLVLFDFAKWYDMLPGKDEDETETKFTLKNDFGMIRLRRKPYLVGSWNFNLKTETGIEGYYRSLLMLFKPFIAEDEIIGLHQTYKEAFDHCCQNYPRMLEYDAKKQKINEMQEMCRKFREEDKEEELAVENEEEVSALLGEAIDNTTKKSEMMREELLKKKVIDKDNLEAKISQLNYDQKKVYDLIISTIEKQEAAQMERYLYQIATDDNDFDGLELEDYEIPDNLEEPLRLVVSGVGGTGKSFLIQVLKEKIESMVQSTYDAVAVIAPTGIAAFNIGGTTIHRFFKLPVQHGHEAPYWPLNSIDKKLFKRPWNELRLIIVDEFSMVSNTTLATIDRRLREVVDEKYSFGKKNIVLFGDLLQLPPVNAKFCFEQLNLKRLNTIFHSVLACQLWPEFQYQELIRNIRQVADPNYAALLSRVRLGNLTLDDIDALSNRLVNDNEIVLNIQYLANYFSKRVLPFNKSAICLLPLNKQVHDFNTAMLVAENINIVKIRALDCEVGGKKRNFIKKKTPKNADDIKICEANGKKDNCIRKKNRKVADDTRPSDTGGLEEELELGIGARVMLRRNINVQEGLVNGALGKIVEFKRNQHEVTRILIKFDNIPEVQSIERSNVPFEISANIFLERYQFPICVAYGITIHKSQGLTLEAAMIDIGSSCFNSGMAYVALSRVTTLANVHLISFDPTNVRCNILAVKEYDRLRGTIGMQTLGKWNQLPPMYQRMKKVQRTVIKDIDTCFHVDSANMKNTSRLLNSSKQLSFASCVIYCLMQMKTFMESFLHNVENNVAVELCKLYHSYSDEVKDVYNLIDAKTNVIRDPFTFFISILKSLDCQQSNMFLIIEQSETFCCTCNAHRWNNPSYKLSMNMKADGECKFINLIPKQDVICQHCNTPDKCCVDRLHNVKRKYAFGNENQYLILQIDLFDNDGQKLKRKISGYNANNLVIENNTFRTIGAILYRGENTKSGNYTAMIRNESGNWIELNDEKKIITPEKKRFVSNLKDVCLLFLERLKGSKVIAMRKAVGQNAGKSQVLLFDDQIISKNVVEKRKEKAASHVPVVPSGKKKLVLENKDSVSCYANSAVQCLIRMTRLSDIIEGKVDKSELEVEISQLCSKFRQGKDNVSNVWHLRNIVGQEYRLIQQQDASSFLLEILSRCDENVQELYAFGYRQAKRCQGTCHSTVYGPFIHDRLIYFTPNENDRLFHDILARGIGYEESTCVQCGGRQITEIDYMFPENHKYMIIHQNIFEVIDIDNHILRRMDLNIAGWNPNRVILFHDTVYRTIAIIRHSGAQPTSGHYICDAVDENDQWFEINDSIVKPKSINDVSFVNNAVLYIFEKM